MKEWGLGVLISAGLFLSGCTPAAPVTDVNFVFTSSGVNLRDDFLLRNRNIFPSIRPRILAERGLTGQQQANKLNNREWILDCESPTVISAALNDMINGVSGDESFDKGFIPVRKAVRQQCSNTRLIDLGSIPVSDLVPIQDRHRQFDKRLADFVRESGDSVYFPASNTTVVSPDGTLRPAFVLNDKHANQAAWEVWGAEISDVVFSH